MKLASPPSRRPAPGTSRVALALAVCWVAMTAASALAQGAARPEDAPPTADATADATADGTAVGAAAETASAKARIVLPPPLETSDRPAGPDPTKCRVVLEDMGDVGLRISDAQALASDVLTALRARVGQEGAVYEGLLKSQKKLKKLLGTRAEVQVQKDQIRYLEACVQHAPFRVRVSFGKRKQKRKKAKGEQIALTCTPKGERAPLAERLLTGPTFDDARARLREAIVDFCPGLDGHAQGAEGAPPTRRESDRWLLPPRR